MEPIRLPNEKEIDAAYEDGKEAVLKLFQDTMMSLAERIQKLETNLQRIVRLAASRHRVMGLINLRHVVYENAVVKGVVDKKGMLDIS
jgi:hypothetical protein